MRPTPIFEALFWTWGDPTHSKRITVHGHKAGISANAEEVLRHVQCYHQKHDRVRLDAICINQSGLEKRGRQVSTMDEISSKTACVLVWPGQEDATTQVAWRHIDQILARCHEMTHGFQGLEERLLHASVCKPNEEVPPPDCAWPSYVEVLCRTLLLPRRGSSRGHAMHGSARGSRTAFSLRV